MTAGFDPSAVGRAGDQSADSAELFAAELRALRMSVGDPTLAALSASTGVSKSVISEAFSGRRLPTERTVVKLVEALGGDREAWVARRHSLDPRSAAAAAADPEVSVAKAPRRLSIAQTLVIAVGAAVVSAALTSTIWLAQIGGMEERAGGGRSAVLDAADGVDPRRTVCTDDAEILASELRADDEVQVQILYSPSCMSAWGRVTRYDGKSAGNSLSFKLYPAADLESARAQEQTAYDVQSVSTAMIAEVDADANLCGIARFTVDREAVELAPPICL
ncbi:DUF2690 domain-containing protein [Leucobacter allii]|uniref:DUF2690 domain-containing protein n=1 Tax=Leucobacter allii TaxID=2932247 RepID=A0ABY4FQ06_9MICO|nr:DUF2690 domain-containing protein [Leucobacter allii]UOQ58365.1 DUF2690 domain-containing protein [Leucobacter allii]UOR02944.1 DUF2690 domain-containing protein [Leucobacter allii]